MERPIRTIIDQQRPVTTGPDTTVRTAAQLMKQHRVGALLVVDNERLAGIFTERDAVFRVLAEKRDPDSTRLRDVMTRNPRTIGPDVLAAEAVLMIEQHAINGLLVLDASGGLAGALNVHDLLRAGVM